MSLWKAGPIVGYVHSHSTCDNHSTALQTFDNATKALYASDMFKQKGEENADFLKSLPQYLDGRTVTIQNMVRLRISNYPCI